jgi:hypothetical protein
MKIHFADSGNFDCANLLYKAGVRYTLQTFFSIEPAIRNGDRTNYELLNKFSHIIIDSGLFSIMFGCAKDKPFNAQICNEWKEKYISYINASKFINAHFVELDVQKKLGVEAAWELRLEMKARINKGGMITPYHLEDDNPDKLIDFADYIAVSIPELRFNVSRKELESITTYITRKASSKGKRIHLLGCTEKKLIKQFNYCYSADSTSWKSATRYGHFKSEIAGNHKTNDLYAANDKIGPFEKKAEKVNYLSACLLLAEYKKYAGDQT